MLGTGERADVLRAAARRLDFGFFKAVVDCMVDHCNIAKVRKTLSENVDGLSFGLKSC